MLLVVFLMLLKQKLSFYFSITVSSIHGSTPFSIDCFLFLPSVHPSTFFECKVYADKTYPFPTDTLHSSAITISTNGTMRTNR